MDDGTTPDGPAISADPLPIPVPTVDWAERVAALERRLADRRLKTSELAADRDRWKQRAERAEPLVDAAAIDKLSKERDALKREVAALQKRVTEHDALQLKYDEVLAAGRKNLQAAEKKAELLEATAIAMQNARNSAQAERDKARADLGSAGDRVKELEDELADLRAPKEAPPKAGGDLPAEEGAGAAPKADTEA